MGWNGARKIPKRSGASSTGSSSLGKAGGSGSSGPALVSYTCGPPADRMRSGWNALAVPPSSHGVAVPLGRQGRTPMKIGMGQNWWILAARAVLAILFGLYVLVAPGRALAAIILAFGVAVLLAGILAIVAAVRVHDQHERSFPLPL